MSNFICNYNIISLNEKNALNNFEILHWFGLRYPPLTGENYALGKWCIIKLDEYIFNMSTIIFNCDLISSNSQNYLIVFEMVPWFGFRHPPLASNNFPLYTGSEHRNYGIIILLTHIRIS